MVKKESEVSKSVHHDAENESRHTMFSKASDFEREPDDPFEAAKDPLEETKNRL